MGTPMTVAHLNRHARAHFNEHGQVKRAWATQVEAERWARLLYTVGKVEIVLVAYQCGVCGMWHLGNEGEA